MSRRRQSILAALVAAPIGLVGAPAIAGQATAAHAGAAAMGSAPGGEVRLPGPARHRTGLAIRVAGATPSEAALTFARAAQRGTGELRVLDTTGDDTTGDDTSGAVVRLQQTVGGIPVLGAQQIVRLSGTAGAYVVRGTSDATVSGLRLPTAATWSTAAIERLVTAGAQRRFPGESVTATAGELVVLPLGPGVLARRVAVTLTRSHGVHDVYVNATNGAIVFDIDRHKAADVVSTEKNLAGQTVRVHADTGAGKITLTDITRAPAGPVIRAEKMDPQIWTQVPVTTPELPFGADDTRRGTIDAHLAVARATDYFKKTLGRNGIDGSGGDLIHVTGMEMANAYWDGSQMVIGLGDAQYKPFSADVDVVAHELTHGVVDNTAGFIYLGQGGAMHEAYADYFGNAVDVGQSAAAMQKPLAALLGEDLCRTLAPRRCAIRDLDDGRGIADYTGTLADAAGVHLNATIFGGALWDIRQGLDPILADKVMYRGLTAYLTPWSDFVDARTATLLAAKDLNLTAAQRAVITRAFDSRGIVQGWQAKDATDAQRVLMPKLQAFSDWFPPAAAGGRWAVADVPLTSEWPFGFFTGRTDGTGVERVALPTGHSVIELETDGRYVAVTTSSSSESGLWLYDTVTKTGSWVARDDFEHFYVYPSLAGGRLAWQDSRVVNGTADVKISVKTIGRKDTRVLDAPGETMVQFPSLSTTTLAHIEGPPGSKDLVVRDARTLQVVARQRVVTGDEDSAFNPIALSDKVVWTYADWDWTAPTGPTITAYVSPRDLSSKRVLNVIPLPQPWPAGLSVQATETSMTQIHPTSIPRFSPNVIQKPLAGGTAVPVTCDLGGAYLFNADEKRAVVWLSGTQGKVRLLMRSTPAGPCR